MKKTLVLLMCCILCATAFVGCSKKPQGNADPVVVDVRIYKAGYGTEWFHAAKEKFEELYKDQNYTINIVEESNSVPDKVLSEIQNKKSNSIDLYITDTKHRIIIENKIYAGDQYHQMKRYWNYGMKKGDRESFRLIYLTLYGNIPSKDSLGDLNADQYICISYKHDIMAWLEKCLELSASQPLIRETIVQYINTIKILTNSNMNRNDEILQILSKPENIDAVFEIFNRGAEFFE